MRITHVIKGLGPGGAEHLILNQVRSSSDPSISYRVVSLVRHKDHLVERLHEAGIEVVTLGTHPTWPLKLRKVLSNSTDIVHAHSPVLAAAVRIIGRLQKNRFHIVTTEHNRWPRHHRLTRLANRATNGLDDWTIAVSEDVRASMNARGQKASDVVRHGIDLTQVAAAQGDRNRLRDELAVSDSFVVGIVANFRPEKDYATFVSAVTEAHAANPDLRWVVVGQGPGEADLRADLRARALDKVVHLTGYRSDVPSVVSAFDVFTLTSRHEGLPVSLMEALALGRPVVATRAGGIPEVLTQDRDALLVDVGDAAAIAAGWLRLAAEPKLAAELGQAARETASLFDAAVSTKLIESGYRRLMTGSEPDNTPAARS